jgi:hypothetical protein
MDVHLDAPTIPVRGIYPGFAAGIPYTTETAIQTTQNFIVLVLAWIPKPAPQCLRASEKLEFRKKIGWLDLSVDG